MVHALQEAHRVLKPNGILIDLRPAPAHRRLGIGEGRRWQFVGRLHEVLDDDHAADAAVARVVRQGLFGTEKRTEFQLDRVLDAVEEARDFLADFDQRRDLPPHTPLLKRLERRYSRLRQPQKIVVRGPMHLAILRKLPAASDRGSIGADMILAILPNTDDAESLLNNLSEADFDLNDVSVIMQNVALRNKIAADIGPLQGVLPSQFTSSLKKAGIAQDVAQRCDDAVKQGRVLIAMKVDSKYQAAARKMFEVASAEIVQV